MTVIGGSPPTIYLGLESRCLYLLLKNLFIYRGTRFPKKFFGKNIEYYGSA